MWLSLLFVSAAAAAVPVEGEQAVLWRVCVNVWPLSPSRAAGGGDSQSRYDRLGPEQRCRRAG